MRKAKYGHQDEDILNNTGGRHAILISIATVNVAKLDRARRNKKAHHVEWMSNNKSNIKCGNNQEARRRHHCS